jgi:uroporphyrin-III C-methyltransferase
MDHGLAGQTPVLVVANASLPEEQLLHTRLDLLPLASRVLPDGAAAVILIGQAVAGHGQATASAVAEIAREAARR